MKRSKFEVYHAKDGWRWRLLAANGRVLASGEAHTRRGDAKRAIKTARVAMIRAALPDEGLPVYRSRPVADHGSADYPASLC